MMGKLTKQQVSANARKGRNRSPWGSWKGLVCKFPELNTSKRLREPCGATPKGKK